MKYEIKITGKLNKEELDSFLTKSGVCYGMYRNYIMVWDIENYQDALIIANNIVLGSDMCYSIDEITISSYEE